MHVLLIGNYWLLLKALKQGLGEEGFTVDVASNRQEADNRIRTAAFDAIVLDLVPPEEPVLSLLQRWRRSGLKTPVLALTAPGTRERIRDSVAAVDDWLTKPFGLDEFLARLQALGGSPERDRTPAWRRSCSPPRWLDFGSRFDRISR